MPSGLPFYITEIIANIVLEFIIIRATCKLLDIRRPIVYGAMIYALLLISFMLSVTGYSSNPPRLLIGLLSMFVIPIALSNEPMHSRILHSLLILAGISACELVTQLVFSLSSGMGNYPEEASKTPIIPVIITYVVSAYTTAIILEVLLLLCKKPEYKVNRAISLPIILLNVCSHLLVFMFSTRVDYTNTKSPLHAIGTLIAVIGTLLISFGTLEIAQRDIAAAKEDADRIALTRQVRHIKAELGSIAKHSARVRKLRHDLANQIGTVDELLNRGQTEAAGLYLSQLQRRADNLIEEKAGWEQRCPSASEG